MVATVVDVHVSVLSDVTAGRLDGGHGGCKQWPRVDCGAAARPRRRHGGTEQRELWYRVAVAAVAAFPADRHGRAVTVPGGGLRRAVIRWQSSLGPCRLRALSDAAWERRVWGGGRRGEAARRVVGLVVVGSGAGGWPARGAWWRSVWLGLECVDGSLAGAGVAAVGGCGDWDGQLRAPRGRGCRAWRRPASARAALLLLVWRVCWACWLAGRCVSAWQGGLWGDDMM